VSVVTFDVDGSFCVSWFSTQVWSYFWHCITTNDTYGVMFIEKYYELKVNIHNSYWIYVLGFFGKNCNCLIVAGEKFLTFIRDLFVLTV
jgi:hypothetical protein